MHTKPNIEKYVCGGTGWCELSGVWRGRWLEIVTKFKWLAAEMCKQQEKKKEVECNGKRRDTIRIYIFRYMFCSYPCAYFTDKSNFWCAFCATSENMGNWKQISNISRESEHAAAATAAAAAIVIDFAIAVHLHCAVNIMSASLGECVGGAFDVCNALSTSSTSDLFAANAGDRDSESKENRCSFISIFVALIEVWLYTRAHTHTHTQPNTNTSVENISPKISFSGCSLFNNDKQ